MSSNSRPALEAQQVPTDEKELFASLAERWTPLSAEIRKIDFRLGEDSDGDLAVWFSVSVAPDLNPSKKKIESLRNTIDIFRKEALEASSARWPYFNIES